MKKLLPCLVLLLAACGQAGPLVLPDALPPPAAEEDAQKKEAAQKAPAATETP